jgi:hypothetical protein
MLFDTNDYLVNEDPEQDRGMYDFLGPVDLLGMPQEPPKPGVPPAERVGPPD